MITSEGSRCAESGSQNTDIIGFRRAKTLHGRQHYTLAQICSAKKGATQHTQKKKRLHENNIFCEWVFEHGSRYEQISGLLRYFIFSVKTWQQELCAPLTTNHFLTTPLFDPKLALLGRSLHLCATLRNKNEPWNNRIYHFIKAKKTNFLMKNY